MSTLAKIRNRAGLLVAIIGIALFAFVLGDLFGSGNIFSSQDNSVGEIAGKRIAYEEFNMQLEQAVEQHKQRSGENTVPQEVRDMLVNQTWENLVNQRVMSKEYERLGITVSDDELYDLMMGSNPHPYIVQYFTDRQTGKIFEPYMTQFGTLNVNKVSEYAQQMNAEQEAGWVMLEQAIREARVAEKYEGLIKKGLYVTQNEAKREYEASNTTLNINYIAKRYTYLPDSTVIIQEKDLRNYYNDHRSEYRVKETTRRIEYTVFNAIPSAQDSAEIKEDLARVYEDFKTIDPKDDSLFVIRESDSRFYDDRYYTKGALPEAIDSLMFSSETGFVTEPYQEGGMLRVSKLIDRKVAPDSVKARHILITYENNDTLRTKAKVDSLRRILTKDNFEQLAIANSADPGSAEKGGDLGWFTEGQMVPAFNDACFEGKVGDIAVVESQFGFHIIEILDQTTPQEKVKVASIERELIASTATMQEYYQEASSFAGKNNTTELFRSAVEESKQALRVADNLKENDKVISGLESPKAMIKWAYEAEIGQVSQAFELGRKFVVATLTDVREKGILPFEQVKERVEAAVRKEKKAEEFIAKMNEILATEKDFENIAIKLEEQVLDVQDLNFGMYSVPGLGRESALLGVAVTLKEKEISKPIKGTLGVYLVQALERNEAPKIDDFTAAKNRIAGSFSGRVDTEVFDALKENAEIVNKLARMY